MPRFLTMFVKVFNTLNMRKAKHLTKEFLQVGDRSRIMEIYNERHKKDGATISLSYVYLITEGKRPATPGTAAQEVVEIAKTYLENKQRMKRDLIAA